MASLLRVLAILSDFRVLLLPKASQILIIQLKWYRHLYNIYHYYSDLTLAMASLLRVLAILSDLRVLLLPKASQILTRVVCGIFCQRKKETSSLNLLYSQVK